MLTKTIPLSIFENIDNFPAVGTVLINCLISIPESPNSPPTSENRFTNVRLSVRVGGLIPTASPNQRGLHPSAKFQQSDNNAVNEINNINILSTDIYYGDLTGDGAKIYIIKTYPASPAYMYQEAICMYPLTRYWRAKVDGAWRSWIKI